MMRPDDGDRMLVPIEVEVPEGWDPAPPLPMGEERIWRSTDELLGGELD